jgi:hypothetical protein
MLSLALWRPGRWGWSVAIGLLAVLTRELALPYLAAMAFMAWREHRLREAAAWACAIALFGAAMLVHAHLVLQQIAAADPGSEWLSSGGWAFVLSTARWNALFLVSPAWLVAIAVPLALVGLAGWAHPVGARMALTAGAYVGAFLVLGRPDNFYWGLMYAPFLALGLLFAWPALRDLWQAAAMCRPAMRLDARA